MKESSEVLARKYRPISFDELIGQETIAQTLSLALDTDRLSHAYLFSGLRGSGKTSTARIFAKALNCEEGLSHQPCGVCSNCINALENRHVDIIEMDAASSRKIDDIRDLIEQTKYKPATARYKIFIIDEVHMLTKEAFNALLKTLEEPPSYVKFILATTDPLKLPATILSRTQHFRFKSIALGKVIDHLAHILNLENIKYEIDALEILARSGSGSLRDTLTLLDQAIIFSNNFVNVNTVTDMLGLVDPQFIAQIFNAVFAKDYAKVVEYTKVLDDYESEMVVDELIAYIKERMYANDALFSTLVIDRFFRILSDSKSLFAINADGSFVLSLIFFKMIEALRIKEIDVMIESLQKEVQRPDLGAINIEAPSTQAIPDTDIPVLAPSIAEVPSVEVAPTPPPQIPDKNLLKFQNLVESIKDRNADLGACFESSIHFISYEDEVLTWESCPDEEGKKTLKKAWSVIQQLVKEEFAYETKITNSPCTKQAQETQAQTPIAQPSMSEVQSTSMIEDAEIGGSASCVTNCESTDNTKELDGIDIKNEPMVIKGIELFEATKITIQSKV